MKLQEATLLSNYEVSLHKTICSDKVSVWDLKETFATAIGANIKGSEQPKTQPKVKPQAQRVLFCFPTGVHQV